MKKAVILFILCLSIFIMAGCDKSVDNENQAVARKVYCGNVYGECRRS